MSSTERRVPKRRWGQNFLRNAGAARRIVEAVARCEADRIVEIGPGEGALTSELLRLGRRLTAIEIDPELVAHLGERFTELEIIETDATEFDYPAEPFCAVGNLPYNVATPILRRVLASGGWRRGVFMLQKEVADRIVARPREEPYGFLTLFVQLYARASILLVLEPGSFHPRPKVRSAVVELVPAEPDLRCGREALISLVSAAFRMRRKTLVNNLTGFGGLGRAAIASRVETAGFGPHARAEELSLSEFDRLGEAIERAGE